MTRVLFLVAFLLALLAAPSFGEDIPPDTYPSLSSSLEPFEGRLPNGLSRSEQLGNIAKQLEVLGLLDEAAAVRKKAILEVEEAKKAKREKLQQTKEVLRRAIESSESLTHKLRQLESSFKRFDQDRINENVLNHFVSVVVEQQPKTHKDIKTLMHELVGVEKASASTNR